jgi:integrase
VATFQKRRGKWRAQIRRNGHELSRTFALKAEAEVWARDAERAIDRQLNPGIVRLERKDTFGGLIDLHLDDLRAVGKPLGRSKDHAPRQLKAVLGRVKLKDLTRERLIQYGRARASGGAGPATLVIDISFIGMVLKHAAAVHGIAVDIESVNAARLALRKLGLIGAPDERDRRPTTEELDLLFQYFDANSRLTMPMTRIVQFAIATAVRQDEIMRIGWSPPRSPTAPKTSRSKSGSRTKPVSASKAR